MALTRIQATGKKFADNTTSLSFSFATLPTLGNALVIPVTLVRNTGTNFLSCVDNQGNTYVLASSQANGNGRVGVYYCAQVVAASGTFTLTITATLSGTYFVAAAVEISGAPLGLTVDQVIGATGTTATPNTGALVALTANDVVLVAAMAAPGGQTAMTVEVVSPTWTEEYEELSATHSVGEGDTRLLTAALGTTPSCSWTNTSSATCSTVLVAFKASTAAAVVRVTQAALEVLSQSMLVVWVTQALIELLTPFSEVVPPTTGQGHVKAKLGNKHGRTDEHGAVIVAPGPAATPGIIGPLTIFPHLCGETTATGLQVTSVTAGALRTPRTPLGTLRVTTDDQGSLRVAPVTAGTLGPLTPLGNLQCRTDETGALLVTTGTAGTLTSAPSPLLNLWGRTDDQGALVVTGLP